MSLILRPLLGLLLAGCGARTCEEQDLRIGARVQAIWAKHRTGCALDSDCAFLNVDLSCRSSCPQAVLVSSTQSIRKELDALDATECRGSSCKSFGDCAADAAFCRSGSCVTGRADAPP